MHRLNTFDDDNEPELFDEQRGRPSRRRPPRSTQRRPQRGGPRRAGPAAGSNSVLRLAGLVAIAIAIVFGLVLACSGRSKGDYATYLQAMQPLAQKSASVGKEFATALVTPGLTMAAFQSKLTGWAQQEKADYVAAQRLRPPGPLQSAHADALATFQLRATSLVGIASTFTLAQQKHTSPSVVGAALASDTQLLSASDTDWEQLYQLPVTETLTAQSVGNVIVPASRIVTNPDILSASSLASLYQRLGTPSSGHRVTGIHGSRLVGTNVVENGTSTSLSPSTTTTVFAGSNTLFNVVFQNSGGYAEVQIKVTLTITVGSHRYTQTKTFPGPLAAGARATVSFTNFQLPGSAYSERNTSISVDVHKVPGEGKLDNNAATYQVFLRLPPS